MAVPSFPLFTPALLTLSLSFLHPAHAGQLPAVFRFQLTPAALDDFKTEHFDVWGHPSFERSVTAAVYTEEEETRMTAFLTKYNMPVDRTEMTKLVEESEARMRGRASLKEPGKVTWDNYYTMDEVYTWMDHMCEKYNKLAKCSEIGKSVEGRPIKMIQISNGQSNPDKKSAFINSMLHAREWISLSSTTYMINELLVNSSDYRYKSLLDKLDIFIIPISNPDGYVYSHTPGKRLWRKNRRPHEKGQENDQCNGVDLNRNFELPPDATPSPSDRCVDPCCSSYIGPAPFSEPETQAIRDAVLKEKGRARFHFDMHAFSQLWLTPWAYSEIKTPDHPELLRVAQCGANASALVSGNFWFAGAAWEGVLYAAPGILGDWAYGVADIKFSLAIELSPQEEPPGFNPPFEDILPAVQSAWAGVLTALFECNVPDPPKSRSKSKAKSKAKSRPSKRHHRVPRNAQKAAKH